jgi:hypothetical protein
MVKSGGFISDVASILKLPQPTIAGAFRVLRENGLMSSGARGVNAPDMIDLDAARMLIAMLVNERPAYAENSVRDFGGLVCTHIEPADFSSLDRSYSDNAQKIEAFEKFKLDTDRCPDRHSFEQAVAELIRIYGDDRDQPYFRDCQLDFGDQGIFDPTSIIEVHPRELIARIRVPGAWYEYSDPLVDPQYWGEGRTKEEVAGDESAEAAHLLKLSRYATAIRSVRSVDDSQITALARMLREEHA